MKKLLFILAFLLFPVAAHATTVTVSSNTIANFNPAGIANDVTLTNVSVSNGGTTVSCSACFRPQWVGMSGFRISISGVAYTVSGVASTSALTITSPYAAASGNDKTVIWYKYVEVRLYADRAFQPAGASYVVQPGVPGSQSWYKRFAASIVNASGVNTLYIPEFTIDSTTDAVGPTNQARYTAGFYRPDSSLVQLYACFEQFRVPATTPTTWTALCAYNSPPAIVPPANEAYTKTQIDARFPSCTSGQMLYYAATGNVLSCLTVGSGLDITAGVLTATGGGGGTVTGSGTANTMAYWSSSSVIATALMGSNLQFSGATLSAKRVREAYNAKLDYGAIGDGVTDDTTAIQNCVTASAGANAFDCYLPAGDYLVTGLTMADGAKLIGDGKLDSTLISTTNAAILSVTGTCLGCSVRRLGILGSKSAGSSQIGLNLAGSSFYYSVIVEDVRIEETGAAGLKITQPYSSTFRDIFIDDTAGFPLDYNAPTAPSNTFENIYVGVVNTTAIVGFRIRSGDFVCTGCNGLNSSPAGGSWASVGTKNGVDGDTADAGAKFTCLHCNLESFNTYGILAYSYSEINLIGKTTLSGNAAGTEKAIYFDNVGDGAAGCTPLPACGFYSQFIARGYIDDTVDFADGVAAYANSQPVHTRSGFAHIQTLGQGPLTGGGNQLTTYYEDALGVSLKLARADGKSSLLAVSTTTSITQPGVKYIEADSTGGAITISIPWAAWYQRAQEPLIIKDVGGVAATNNITISGVGGTVNGSSYVISNNGDSVILMPDGNTGAGDWRVVSGGGATSLPVPDTQTIVKGSTTASKLLRFEIDGFTAATTRVITPPDANITLAGQNYANNFTALNTFNIGTSPAASVVVTSDALGVAGTRDSGWLVLQGQSYDTSAHTANWKQVVDVTGNDGTSTFRIENRIDAAAYNPVLWLTKPGDLQTYSLYLYGKTISTDDTNSYMLADMLGTMTKNNTNTRNFFGVRIYPEINTGGSNTNTTFQVLQIDTLNTAITGVTTNLINAAYNGTTVFKLTSAGHVLVGGDTTASELRFLEPSGSGANYTAFKSPVLAGDVTYTLPSADGTVGQCLSTNGSGTLSWGACSAGAPGSAALTATYVGYGDGANLLTGEAAFNYTAATNTLDLDHMTVTQSTTTIVPFILTAVAASSVELFQIKDSGGSVRGGYSTAGAFFFRGFSSGPTTALANDAKLYFDITGGATTQQLLLSKNTGQYNPIVTANQASYTSTRLVRWSATSFEVDDISGATSNGTSVTFSSGNLIATTPTITTSLVTGSTTFALLNTTATTINFAGAATTLNVGASATMVLNFGGSTSAAEFRFLEPSGSGTNYTGFKAVAQAGNVTYTLPNADGTAGYCLSTNGAGALSWAACSGGAGTPGGSSGEIQWNNASTLDGVQGSVVTANGTISLVPTARTSGSASYFSIFSPADTTLAAGVESPGIAFEMSATRQWATGGITTQREAVFYAPTYAFVGASTITTAATVAITDAPSQGAFSTITNAYALWIQGGAVRHDGATLSSSQVTYSLLNTATTTINFGGAATTINLAGGVSSVVNLGGGTGAATLRFLEPSGSGTNYTGFKAQAQAGNVTYTLPAADGTSGYVLSTNGSGTLSWTTQGAATLTVGTSAIASGTAGTLLYETAGNVLGEVAGSSVDANGAILFAHTARSSGNGYYFAIQNNTDTAITGSSESVGLYYDLSANRTWAAGNITTQREMAILSPTYTITGGASTITTAATFAVDGAPTAGASTTLTNAYALWVQSDTSRFDGTLINAIDNSTTNAADTILNIQHSSSGTPAANFGAAIRFGLESSTTVNQDAGSVAAIWTTATHASRTSALVFSTVSSAGASAERMRVNQFGAQLTAVLFSALGSPSDGTFTYCSDCTVTSGADNTCAGSGTGAFAARLNGVWRCFNAQN